MAAEIKIRVWKSRDGDTALFTVARRAKAHKASRDMFLIDILLSNETAADAIVVPVRAWKDEWEPNVSEKDSHNASNMKKIIISKSIFKPEHKLHGDL